MFLLPVPPALLLDDSAGMIAREIWIRMPKYRLPESSGRQIRSFLVDIIPPLFSMLTYHLGINNRPVGGCNSEM
jgi:hypothetical protein